MKIFRLIFLLGRILCFQRTIKSVISCSLPSPQILVAVLVLLLQKITSLTSYMLSLVGQKSVGFCWVQIKVLAGLCFFLRIWGHLFPRLV